jgi:type I restriction enzyme M protein
MFVQHMLAVLKSNGRMATVMPHGVLFRGGEEKEARKLFIERGWLDAVIGLPPSLFYGTGIPACILVMNKEHASERKDVLFVNADREYREGKAQNFLRPEDMAKIVDVYRKRADASGYARVVPVEEIAAEDYNCNIRRYVDNAPPPEPQDVRAHIHGGVPTKEIVALETYWSNYAGLREACFAPRAAYAAYCDFVPDVSSRRDIAALVRGHGGVMAAHAGFMQRLEDWWRRNLPAVAQLAPAQGHGGNVYALRRALVADISAAFADQTLLNGLQIRGAMARYVDELKADLKSVAASGWGAELIPADELLQSQFPELVEELASKRSRLEELQALFAAADDEDFEDEEDSGVMPGSEVKRLKDEAKTLATQLKTMAKEAKAAAVDLAAALSRHVHSSVLKLGGSLSEPDFEAAKRIVGVAERAGADELFIVPVRKLAEDGPPAAGLMASIASRLERHKALEDEAKALKADLRAAEKKQEELVARARAKITPDQARDVLLERFRRKLVETYRAYLDADRRAVTAAIENLHDKYAVTVREIETARQKAAAELGGYLKALGYV